MNILSAALVIMSLVFAINADARPGNGPGHRPGGGGWHGDNSDTIKKGQRTTLGTVKIGSKWSSPGTAEVINIRNRTDIGCGLTHIQLSAGRDSVLINRVEVDYRWGSSDTIDLNDDNRPRPPGNRRGIHLRAGESSRWLDIDDVADGRPNGRCVERIKIYGIDTPDQNRPGRPGNWRPDRPATVKVTGLVKKRPSHGGRP